MENKTIYYKENIKDRMYKNAAKFWGIRSVENLDPMVKLLIEGLASEVYKLSNEINNIEIRILERISSLLTPGILMAARPAHMIMHAIPIENEFTLNKLTGFFYDNPVFQIKNDINGVGFYPVDSFNIIKGRVKSLICGKNMYLMDEYNNKTIFTRSMVKSERLSQHLWIGLDFDPTITNVKNLSFYFDFPRIDAKSDYFQLLPFSKWKYGDKQLKTDRGIFVSEESVTYDDSDLFSKYDLANISDRSVKRHYNHRFIQIQDEMKTVASARELFPSEIEDLFDTQITQQLKEPLYWVSVHFPPNFEDEVIEDITVSINAFPVANKKLLKESSNTQKLSNVITLNTSSKESFLSVNSVTDLNNNKYKQLPFRNSDSGNYSTYTVKRGGTERFDSRDAKEYISCLIDLLRDEGAAFSSMGKGFLNDKILEMSQLMSSLSRKVEIANENREIPSYVIVDSQEKDGIIFVEYWATLCELANDIKAGSNFANYNETFVQSECTFNLTPSTGGKGCPKSADTLDRYKFVLTSRDRLYTNEDIINFCHSEFSDIISFTEVKKGVQMSLKPKEGLIRTIDVHITLKRNIEQISSEHEIKEKLLNLLIQKSPDSFNYRVLINKSATV